MQIFSFSSWNNVMLQSDQGVKKILRVWYRSLHPFPIRHLQWSKMLHFNPPSQPPLPHVRLQYLQCREMEQRYGHILYSAAAHEGPDDLYFFPLYEGKGVILYHFCSYCRKLLLLQKAITIPNIRPGNSNIFTKQNSILWETNVLFLWFYCTSQLINFRMQRK